MCRKLNSYFLILFMFATSSSYALEPIKVLVARTGTVSDAQALPMLIQLNNMMSNSSLGGLQFINAKNTSPLVYPVTCLGTNGQTLINCARTALASTRSLINADIVLLMAPQVDQCGSVRRRSNGND